MLKLFCLGLSGFLLWICLPGSLIAQENNTVVWLISDFPPVTITSGSQKDQGYGDRARLYLQQHLTEYQHEAHIGNTKRMLEQIQLQHHVCATSILRNPEREAYIEYSLPMFFVLPNGIVIHQKNQEKFTPFLDQEGAINLTQLMNETKLYAGYANGRSYGKGIDTVLKSHSGQDHLFLRSGDDLFDGLLGMLDLGRLDYLFGYAVEAKYFAQKQNQTHFLALPVQESDKYLIDYVGCPKNDWGRSIIAKINPWIAKAQSKDFKAFYESWLDEATLERYRKMFQQYYVPILEAQKL